MAESLEEVEARLLTPTERAAIALPPRWELDPPQREEYGSDLDYVKGLKAYAQRVIERDSRARR